MSDTRMKLTDGERLIALMLAQVSSQLGWNADEDPNGIDPAFVTMALERGHPWAIREKHSGLFPEQDASDEVVRETTDWLWMFMLVEEAFEGLTDGDRTKVEAALPYPGALKFKGFDGNHEGEYASAARMLLALGRFSRFKDHPLTGNTIHATPRYREQYAKFWAHLDGRGREGLLDADELIGVFGQA